MKAYRKSSNPILCTHCGEKETKKNYFHHIGKPTEPWHTECWTNLILKRRNTKLRIRRARKIYEVIMNPIKVYNFL